MFAEQVGEKISYEKILAPEDGFVEAAKAFLAQEGAVGCNVTMPFRQTDIVMQILDLANRHHARTGFGKIL